ncbi:DUF6777 domain-containing protein [Streptomyces sp. enrichment culture]|uniref:DUF6777 domain-containing protein n=1 Tax=Streptomyces sp. enrichment culture TaxID=1795815 RepID=UPI003F544900
MSVEPPSSDRPTGPPSGPLSGPSQPPSGPPSPPPPGGGGSSAGPPGPGRRPWWRSVPGIAAVAAAVAAAVILAVVFTRPDGGSTQAGGGEVFLQAADSEGPDPFTESTAKDDSAPTATPSVAPTGSAGANEVRTVDGAAPGLYGGTRDAAACDVEQQIRYLREVPAKNEAFAAVADVAPSDVPGYLRSLTPLQLRMDTRVTNHGYRDGAATRFQAVLQAGTAVLVDDRGVPRVRCACGNPLTEPVAQSSPRLTGTPWPGFDEANTVVVEPSDRPVKKFVVRDADGGWFERNPGDTGGKDRPTEPPDHRSPSATPSTPSTPPTDGSTTPDGLTTPADPPTTGTEPAPDTGDTTPTGEPPASESSAPPPPPPVSDTPESAGTVSAPPDVSS